MPIMKCKMCGGTLEVQPGESIAICDSCGTKQTLPRFSDDRRANMYDRANYFRRNGDFDKAEGLFESILAEDSTDCESYWSLVLCRYGISYVEDPRTHRQMPTVNRAQYTPVQTDENYLSALKYADGYQREIYESEAKQIDAIQKGILAISGREDPFDVFICYKDTDSSGERTKDSVYAQDIYNALVKEGYKVFFSRITLEGKLGSEYEPYIFAALNSAKVMLAVGTCRENLESVWVKNEWSRYISLIKKGADKTLIPVYAEMSPYELPEEFSHLVAQDITKIGFIQDLLHGIAKICTDTKTEISTKSTTGNLHSQTQRSEGENPLIERMFMFLEDGDFESADGYCERVLDQEPRNTQAYLGKLMIEYHVQTKEQLGELEESFESSNNYKRIIRYGDENIISTVNGYLKQIADKKEYERQSVIYDSCVSKMQRATTEDAYKQAAKIFREIPEFKDAIKLAQKCDTEAEAIHKNKIYDEALSLIKNDAVPAYQKAISMLKPISGWRDADKQIAICARGIETIKAREESERQAKLLREEALRIAAEKKAEEERLEKERREEEKRQIKERREAAKLARSEEKQKAKIQRETEISIKKHKNKAVKIAIPVIAVLLAVAIVIPCVIIPGMNYSKAVELYNSGDYESAKTAFANLGDYKDSATQIENCASAINDIEYTKAVELMNAGDYEEAISIFTSLNGYKNSAANINSSNDAILEEIYTSALELKKNGSYEEAISLFENLGDFKDSSEQVTEIKSNRQYIKNCDVGDTLFFGSYEQDNNLDNGKEPIEWQVLDKQDGKILVISKYALDSLPYNTTYNKVTWKTCSLRKWMNDTFYNEAFTTNEQAKILTTTLSEGGYSENKTFLLSESESKYYFEDDEVRKCTPTKFAIANGAFTTPDNKLSGTDRCYWWLRSLIGNSWTPNCAMFVNYNGSCDNQDNFVSYAYNCVRPAMWIDTSTKVGDTITFGSYEQDNNLDNGKEAIEWQVLDIKDDKMLVISKYALDCQPYDTKFEDVTWETCTLREWMNKTFYNEAFDLGEQTVIQRVSIPANENHHTNYTSYRNQRKIVDPGNSTEDMIFLIDIDEAESYFTDNETRKCIPTEYAKSNGAQIVKTDAEDICWWWLRTLGCNQDRATSVSRGGTLNYDGNAVNHGGFCVRPAMWINIDYDTENLTEEKTGDVSTEIVQLGEATVGSMVKFGAYEQDNDMSNGKEEIEWQVLDKQDDKILVISKYAIDAQRYNTLNENVTWENCSIRKWLNDDFLNAAFSDDEQIMIQETYLTADKNPKYNADPGKSTTDKIFLLSTTEAENYFTSNEDRECEPTEHSIVPDVWRTAGDKPNCWWWLRSPGYNNSSAVLVSGHGEINYRGSGVSHAIGSVRPAMWISIE